MNDAFIELDGAWRPIREAFVERYGAWAPERLRLVGHDGQWVEAYDAEPVTAKDIVDVERLSYRAGAPLQGGLELFGRGLDATAPPDPPLGAFYPLASNLSDRLENFSSLVSHGTEAPMPSIVDGAGAYVFDAAKQQYVSLPLSINSASAYYDLLGFMGNDGASSDERGKKHWELGCKFRAVSLPAPGQVQFVVFAGTATQNIAVGFDSAGTLFAQFVNGAYAKKLEIPGVVAVGAWVGFVYRHRPSGAARFLELQAHTATQTPHTLVTDRLKLKQILHNLLSNAIKFTATGSVELRVEPSAQSDHVLFHVKDTGPGIPPEQYERIFEKFSQGHARISYEHGGTGLGLSLSRALAELLGGTLTMQSHVGEGSVFTLCLPVQPPAALLELPPGQATAAH